MVCTKCKKDYSAEKSKCPYCGAKNPLASVHKENIKNFNTKYAKAVKTQKRKSAGYKKTSSIAGPIALIAVIIIFIMILSFSSYSKKNDNGVGYGKKHKAEICAQIEKYIASDDYYGLGLYTDELGLVYTTTLTEVYKDYEEVLTASLSYMRTFSFLEKGSAYYDLAAENVSRFYRDTDTEYLKIVDEETKEALKAMRLCFDNQLLEATSLTKDEVSSLKYHTKSQISRLLNRKVK